MGRKALLKELEKLDYRVELDDVLAEMRDEDMCSQEVADVVDPGIEVEIGEDGRVEFDDLGRAERIILPDNNLLPVHFLEEGANKQRSVARVARKNPAGGWGTGWLVGRDILMTNNHVIPSKQSANALRAEFNYQFDVDGSAEVPDTYDFDPDGFFYTNPTLDFTLIKLTCKPFRLQLPVRVEATGHGDYLVLDESWDEAGPVRSLIPDPTDLRPPVSIPPFRPPISLCISAGSRWGRLQLPRGAVSVAVDQHVNIVQHPRGRRKEVAVQQNRLTHIFSNHLRYTTDTEPGSSGSPVFNNGWDLLAIHHAGGEFSGGAWKNNQGVRVDRIVADIRANHAAGSYVRGQLGI